MRLLCAAVALVLGTVLATADDNADKLAALKKKYDKELAELKQRFEEATTAADKDGIRAEARELALITAQSAIKIAEAEPKSDTGFDASMFVIEKAGKFGGGKELEAALGIISEHHLNNAKVKTLFTSLGGTGAAGDKFLKAAAEKATDKEVKGIALFYLGMSAAGKVDEEEDGKALDELVAKAKGYLEQAAKEAPDAKIGNSTVAKESAKEIEALKAIKVVAVGKPAPAIEGTDLEGKKVKLDSFKGKVVLLDVWATWCGPCRAMIPHEREMVKNLKDKPFVLLSVSCDNEQETLTKFLEKEPMPWAHWFDGRGGVVAKTFRVRAFPTLYLIDHTGVIREKWVGSPGNEKLDKAVEELVKEAIKAKG